MQNAQDLRYPENDVVPTNLTWCAIISLLCVYIQHVLYVTQFLWILDFDATRFCDLKYCKAKVAVTKRLKISSQDALHARCTLEVLHFVYVGDE